MNPDSGTNQTLAQAIAETPQGVSLAPSVPADAEISFDIDDVSTEALVPQAPAAPAPAPTPAPTPTPTPTPAPSFEVELEEPSTVASPTPLTTPAVTQPPEPATLPPQRDYSAYPQELVPVLRQLNNKAFAEYAPQLKAAYEARTKATELETKLQQQPKFYHEHPDAYQLDPEYRELTTHANFVQFEANHWRNQLVNIKQGKPWQELKGYDKNNRPVFEDVAAPEDGTVDAQAEVLVQQMLGQASGEQSRVMANLSSYQQRYQQSRQSAEAELNEVRTKLFPTLRPDTLEGIDKENYKLAVDITPQALRGHPLAQLNHLAFVAYHRLQRAYATLMAEHQKLKTPQRPTPAATPAPSAVPSAPPTTDDEQIPFDIDDL
jgi:hypothetical protein